MKKEIKVTQFPKGFISTSFEAVAWEISAP